MNWLYLALNLGSIAIPLAFSFEKRARFYKNWPALFPALIITAAFFLVWDFWFTEIGIWHFNPEYVSGYNLVNLPFEEWMFFIFIPYACVFIHESLKYYFKKTPFDAHGKTIAIVLGILFLIIGLTTTERLYTTVTFTLLGLFLMLIVYAFNTDYLGRFFLTYLVSLIPFALVNGILTGMPVLIYNNNENLALRIGTIPIEDFFYSMLMLLINITIYEHLLHRNQNQVAVQNGESDPVKENKTKEYH